MYTFDEQNHILKLGDEVMLGGSGFKKHFSKPFDAEKVAKICERSWRVDAEILQKIWSIKGKDSSSFGTSIHNILEKHFNMEAWDAEEALVSVQRARENYAKYHKVGDLIAKNKKGEGNPNYARPSHPDLRKLIKGEDDEVATYVDQVIEEFVELNEQLGFTGKSVQEPLVTYAPYKMGGFLDRMYIVDEDKKICRVQDYKIQVGANKRDSKNKLLHEFADKESTKLAGHALQLNYYAYCLHMAGWTIEGLDLFVRENEWNHYELELYDMDWYGEIIRKYNLD